MQVYTETLLNNAECSKSYILIDTKELIKFFFKYRFCFKAKFICSKALAHTFFDIVYLNIKYTLST